jgi:hypothetical protein
MFEKLRSPRRRDLRPSLDPLEERALLNAAPLQLAGRVSAHVFTAKHHNLRQPQASDPNITIINQVGGYRFTNFDGPNAGNAAGTGTTMNGIANSGTAVGFTTANDGTLTNFTANPLKTTRARLVNIIGSTTAMAFGINFAGTVVGADGNGNAFSLNRHGVLKTFIPDGGSSAMAFGINDRVNIVGQFVTSIATPGFILVHGGKSLITINAPSGPNTVFAQGINNKGLVVGFYVGTDGQDHGFTASDRAAKNGTLTGTAVADPTIPAVPGEPGATFVFSQILGINDHGIAVGYYGDSTTSQHGFIYNTNTGTYTFLDDPNAAFNNGVEITQITGITNSGEITGFYSDANGVFHGFVATTHAT